MVTSADYWTYKRCSVKVQDAFALHICISSIVLGIDVLTV